MQEQVVLHPVVFTKFCGDLAEERRENALRVTKQLLNVQAEVLGILLQWPSAKKGITQTEGDIAVCLYDSVDQMDSTLGEIALGVRGSFFHTFGISHRRIPKSFRKKRGELYEKLTGIPPRSTRQGLVFEPAPPSALTRLPLTFHDFQDLKHNNRVGEIFRAVVLERDWSA